MDSQGGYENAPATRMLATHCAVCGRPLVDAVSVDAGIGPECRKKYGFTQQVTEEARAEANRIVYQIALQQSGIEVAQACVRLRELGFDKLADVVLKRVCPVRIEQDGDRFLVKSPYSEQATAMYRAIRGRRWDGEKKVNTFPTSERRQLFRALVSCYLNMLAVGPRGPFILKDGGDR